LRERLTSAPKMTAFENGAEWHHPLSTPHLLITSDQQVTYSKGFGKNMLPSLAP
jgi:hypothetical protein